MGWGMEAELASLAVSGATTLVGLMASDAWAATKSRVAALLSRGRAADPEAVEGELAESRSELIAARDSGDESVAADIEATLRTQLRRLLKEEPAAAAALRELIAEAAPAQGTTTTVHNTARGEFHGPVVQAGDIHGDLNFGGAR
jgi:hypothetical protein